MTALLEIEGLNVEFGSGLWPVRDLDISINAGETLCIVGKSGSGKSLTALALMDLLPRSATRRTAKFLLDGTDLARASHQQMEDIRGSQVAMIFQEPMTSLNPAFTIGFQLEEVYRRHIGGSRAEARARAEFLLEKVGIVGARSRLGQYPHQLSGGLRQRVMIAMALMCKPKLIVADEPTTALDVTVQAQTLHLLSALQKEIGMGLLLITHDLGVVARVATKVAVMYAGQIVETGAVADVFTSPAHPYTQALLACIPVPGRTPTKGLLETIPGLVPALYGDLGGCHFRNRCAFAAPACAGAPVDMREIAGGREARCVRVDGGRAARPEMPRHDHALS